MFIVLLGAIKGIPRTYYEVATIDGAGMWHKLWYVTLPMISPSLFYVVVLTTIRAFQEVTGPLIIFTTSSYAGPLNAGLFYTKYLYQVAFLDGRMGYASALAWVLFAILLVLTTINFVVIGRRVYYGE
jgi:multiple sugar transport system permease protein